MTTPLRVLVVEDSEDDLLLVVRELEGAGYEVRYEQVEKAHKLEAALDRQAWDLVLGDYTMPGFSGMEALSILRGRGLETPFIFVSGTIGEDVAVAGMKAGASDYVIKGNLKRLVPAVRRELREAEVRAERRRVQKALAERSRMAELSSEIGIALTTSLALDEALRRCSEALARHLDGILAGLWAFDDRSERLGLRSAAGHSPQLLEPYGDVSLGQAPIGLVGRELRPILSAPLEDSVVPDRRRLEAAQVTAFAGYPLVVRSRLVGVMAVFSRRPLFGSAVSGLASVADEIAVAIERSRTEEALRQSEERFFKVFDASPAGIAISDLEAGRFLDVNQAFLGLIGYERDEVIGRPALELGIWSAAQFESLIGRLERGGELRGLDLEVAAKGGERRDLLASFERIELEGRPCVLALFQDVTERQRLEEQLRHSQRMEAIGRLAGGIAHDFNNLLTVIIGCSELLSIRRQLDEEEAAEVAAIRRAADGAAKLTNKLLAFGRRRVQRIDFVDLGSLLAGAERLLLRLIGEDVELITRIAAPATATVEADPTQLEQVILNLAVNSRDAMPEGGRLTLATEVVTVDAAQAAAHPGARPGDYALLTVTDTGSGMDEETRARIFEPFFTTKEVGKGTGLGLSMVYGTVVQSGGFLSVESEPGRGTTFEIYLPLSDSVPVRRAEIEPPAESTSGNETILLVEDSPAVRTVTRRLLEGDGYTVLEAADATQGLELAAAHGGAIDLLFTDIVLPGMSGRELADELKRRFPRLRILFTSGYTTDAVVRRGLQDKSIDFLEKPFSGTELGQRVRAVLDAPTEDE